MKLFPAKCHERATLRKLWRQTGNSSLLPGQQFTVDCCCKWWLESQRGFQILLLSFVLLYNKSLNDWSLGEQWILFPSNLNVSLDFVSGNIEILGKQNSLFPSGPVIKCLISFNVDWIQQNNLTGTFQCCINCFNLMHFRQDKTYRIYNDVVNSFHPNTRGLRKQS